MRAITCRRASRKPQTLSHHHEVRITGANRIGIQGPDFLHLNGDIRARSPPSEQVYRDAPKRLAWAHHVNPGFRVGSGETAGDEGLEPVTGA